MVRVSVATQQRGVNEFKRYLENKIVGQCRYSPGFSEDSNRRKLMVKNIYLKDTFLRQWIGNEK